MKNILVIGIVIIIMTFGVAKAITGYKSIEESPASKIVENISYFTDYKGCEWIIVRNHTEDAGLNTSLVKAYFQISHMPTCCNPKHCK
jgi:Ni/Fe-hydrogenase subunit HybB-like protein